MARLLFTARQFGSLADPTNQKTNTELADLIGKPVQFMHQTHSNNLHLISTIETAKEDTDSLITDSKDLALAVRVADCIPLLLYSKNLVAAVHVGRKGLLNEVAAKTVTKMKSLGADKIYGLAGPHICGNCYEVGTQMAEEIYRTHPATKGKKDHLNLFSGLKEQLQDVTLENIDICTKENSQYFSYRAAAEAGRQVGVISL
jgi:YfiH family protein